MKHFTRRLVLFLLSGSFLSFSGGTAIAQFPYSEPVYEVRTEEDIAWATATGYDGRTDTLHLDLFKPAGDQNCRRPVFLMVHGGAWISGSRKDPEVRAICRQMAQRGFLAASTDYRLGFHKRASYTPYAVCPLEPCLYAVDSSEIRRAVFRGMQDGKGALRYLSTRLELDSADFDNVFIGGVSAGAFIALQTTFLDLPAEKPAAAFELLPVEPADPDLAGCNVADPGYDRPDLGAIDGELYPDLPTPSIRGVAAFMGGAFEDFLSGPDTPAVYLYHQTNDLIVSCQLAAPLRPMFQHCVAPLNLCQPMTPLPVASGSCVLGNQLESLGQAAPPHFIDIINNGPPNGLTCFAEPPTHSIANIPLRCQHLADLFAPLIADTGNDPVFNCLSANPTPESPSHWEVYPNPCTDRIHIRSATAYSPSITIELFLPDGRRRLKQTSGFSGSITVNIPADLPPGCYLLRLSTPKDSQTFPLIKR